MARIRQKAKSEVSTHKALDAALHLFSNQGFGGTSMREIAEESGLSVGNLYHHFESKEAMFQRLLDDYWKGLQDPEHPLRQLYERADFPEDLEQMAEVIDSVIKKNAAHILLFYVDIIEFRGKHVRAFYTVMAREFRRVYGEKLEARKAAGELADIDQLTAVIFITRWFFYFFTVETCFEMPSHFGMDPASAVKEFIRILRYGVLPRAIPGTGVDDGAGPAD